MLRAESARAEEQQRRDSSLEKPKAPEAGTSEADEIVRGTFVAQQREGLTTPGRESTGNVSSPNDEALPEGMAITAIS